MNIKSNTVYRTKNGFIVKTTEAAIIGEHTWIRTNKTWLQIEIANSPLKKTQDTILSYSPDSKSNHNSNRDADVIEELKIEDYPELYL